MAKLIRIKTKSYTPIRFFELLNNYYKKGWKLIYYNEREIDLYQDEYEFTVVLELSE